MSGKDHVGWSQINFRDIQLGERIGGGGVGVIYNGKCNISRYNNITILDTDS